MSPVTFLALSNEVSLPHYDPLKPIAIVLLNSGEWRINGSQNKLVEGDIASYLSEDLLLKHTPKDQSEMSADVILLEHDLLEAFLNSYTPPTHHLQNTTGLSSDKLGNS
ncbi:MULTISPECIES: hypothetical protein [unclassified Vibrio]|uniref:hypothetical protein n=1 Tax=unclassified Vibrio TaxID=2614977 RepID=UPI0012E84CD2|nr:MULTISPECIES: hypothetical protein [unclassified Vibrio]